MFSQQQPVPHVVKSLLGKESDLPTNVFQLNGAGRVHEGMHIELGHPVSNGQPVLMLGEYFILRNNKNGCLYTPSGSVGFVRRMTVDSIELGNGRKPLKLLTRPESSDTSLYLVVDPSVKLPQGATPNVNFWFGVPQSPLVVAQDFRSGQALLVFRKDGDSASVFYTDGTVRGVVRRDSILEVVELSIEEQARKRVDHALENIRIARTTLKDEEALARRTDVFYHMIVEVLKVGGKRSTIVFDMVFDLLNAAGGQGELRSGVQHHVREVLSKLNPSAALQFNLNCQRFDAKRKDNGAFGNVHLLSDCTNPKGPPPSARAKKAARSARDAAERSMRRGSSQEIPLHQNGGKNSKKK
ncbi:MAG: hypothetical protein KA104_01755 [Candidatus Pacebacteria bacterium]|nr:hypothetical protein [Candidatus Paceibacterota bacterium]